MHLELRPSHSHAAPVAHFCCRLTGPNRFGPPVVVDQSHLLRGIIACPDLVHQVAVSWPGEALREDVRIVGLRGVLR
eukprot:14682207-Heterocapsa_arctica.AAC.1